MPDPRRHRFARPLLTKQFRYAAAVPLSAVLLCIGSATAWAAEPIVIDFVRHGQSVADAMNTMDTTPPGTVLTADGQAQAQAIADVLARQGPYAGIYASPLIRTQETAAPLASMLGMHAQILPGLSEIGSGIFGGSPVYGPEGLLYLLAPFAWVLGADFVPIPGSIDANGIAFDESFSSAVQTIYDNTAGTGGSTPTDLAFSSEGAITAWTLMNVNNPDFPAVLTELLKTGQLLPNTGTVVIEGDPTVGWTLVSWDGHPVPPASLPTELFVDVRDLITAPQMAAYHISEALLTGDPTTMVSAIGNGVEGVGAAAVHFPLAVTQDLINAVGGFSVGDLSADLANVVPTIATELSGALPGQLSVTLGDVLASL